MQNDKKSDVDQHLLAAIMRNAVDAIITINDRGIMTSVNPATERLFKYTESETIGENVSMLMPSPYRDEHDTYLANYLRSGVAQIIGIGREVVGQRKDGSIFPMHLAVSEVAIDDRRMFTGIVRDISVIKKAEQRLADLNNELENRVAQRTKELETVQAELLAKEKLATLGQVSGGIAHEIRNPLNAIKTSTYYLLNASQASEEKKREYLERIDRQVTVIDNVVTALSDVARLPDATMSPNDCRKLIESASRQVTMAPTIAINNLVPEELPPVFADENQIPLVFQNLIRNARDAMPDGGEITIAANHTENQVSINVIDTGCGIEPADLPKIMEPLFSTKARGMGLGLAICKAIVEKNNGTIDVVSQVGRGSTFTVTLSTCSSTLNESH